MQQPLRPHQRKLYRCVKPTEIPDFCHARCFEQQHCLREIHPMDFRRLELGPSPVIGLAP